MRRSYREKRVDAVGQQASCMRSIAIYLSNFVLSFILLWVATADSVIESVVSVVTKPEYSPRALRARIGSHVNFGCTELVLQQSTSAL